MLLLKLLALIVWASTIQAYLDPSRYTWYNAPASDFAGSLPIGNGRLAAAVWGTAVENITLNENSIWSGPFQYRVNPDSHDGFLQARSLLQRGNFTAAGQVTLQKMASIPTSPREYHPLGAMQLDFKHNMNYVTNYTRYLDLYNGNAVVEYEYDGVRFSREYIASNPAGILAMKFSASEPDSITMACSLSRGLYVTENSASSPNGTGILRLKAKTGNMEDPMRFTAEARIISRGGRVISNSTTVAVRDASSVEVFFDTETSYRYSTEEERETEVNRRLTGAARRGYNAIRKAAVADYTGLSRRVDLNLGSSGSAGHFPTDVRLQKFKGDPGSDPELVTLMFNFGRHSLIASSRRTESPGLPANLQGIWNQDYAPAWGGKFTVDVNLEMNYWPAEVTNLADTFDPFIDLLETVVPHGTDVARRMYQCDNEGYILHHNTDLWGDAAPVDNGTTWTMWPMGSAWLSENLMQHYRFTQNKKVLRERIWPLLQSAARFYYCYLFEFDGYYSTGPSLSPENAFIVPVNMNIAGRSEGIDIAPTMDNALLYELFRSIIEAAEVLAITGDDVNKAQEYISKIRPPEIGSIGQIKEWRVEYEEEDPGHRHMSPIVGLYPGSQLTPLVNQTLANAAKVLLDRRIDHGSGSTGWSRTWTMCLYARLFDGDAVWNHTQVFLQTYPSTNLWNTDSGPGSAFQIDGNFGFTAGVAEMLLQSHELVHILPALPSAVPAGQVSGLVARGNFVVDIQWANGVLTQATVKSRSGVQLALRVQDGKSFTVNGDKYTGPISTVAGDSYKIMLLS
ncbi:Six-hairpin glycosidase-like protein [Aspergillus ambiguus]|uniref:glycoside hydrolase family 95 protein n=1 Tax=Aspergillus ambiguus TaxID=176160 RepID=UPI003CCE48E1